MKMLNAVIQVPPIDGAVKVHTGGEILSGVVTSHDTKDGLPCFIYEYDFQTASGEVVKRELWAWPEQIYTQDLEQAIENLSFDEAQDLLDNFCGVGCNDEHGVESLRKQVRQAYFNGDIPVCELTGGNTPWLPHQIAVMNQMLQTSVPHAVVGLL